MNKLFKATLLSLAILGLTGCATTGFSSHTGGAIISLQTEAGEATEHDGADKTGEACSSNILGLIAMGDSTVSAAMASGGIQTVSTIDYKYLNILALYGKVCTIVTGS
jgi:hypothetical protein